MTVIVDTNVLLDVFQRRQPHYAASAAVLSMIAAGQLAGFCAGHELPAIYYIVSRSGTTADAESAVDNVLATCGIIGLDKQGWQEARSSGLSDFEDAAVVVAARRAGAAFIITRNEKDFAASVVPAISPAAFLSRFAKAP